MRTLIAALALVPSLAAQTPPVRQIGRLEHATTDSLASANSAVPLPDGRVLVNDLRSRRLLLFDSTLAHPIVLADTTSATAEGYGRSFGSLIRFRGDSALFVDVGSLSMVVVRADGRMGRVLAIPRPGDAQRLLVNFGIPGFDTRGRLVYHAAAGLDGVLVLCCLGSGQQLLDPQGHAHAGTQTVPKPDSAWLVAADLGTRGVDTLTSFKIHLVRQRFVTDNDGFVTAIEQTRMPLPIVDGWAVMADGTVAVVRGRDYHVDWLDASGQWTSSPKLPFAWQQLDDTRKAAIIDSATRADQARAAGPAGGRAGAAEGVAPGANGGGRGGGRGAGGAPGGGGREIPGIVVRADLQDVPDYAPPFDDNAVFADVDNRLWVRTSTIVDHRPVYDVIDRRGELVDRVQLPAFRNIAGFGRGVVYLTVQDAAGAVHLERVRVP